MPVNNWDRLFPLNLDVDYPFLQTVLAKIEWKCIKIAEDSVFSPSISIKWKITCELFLAIWMPLHNWSRLFSFNWDVAYPFLWTVLGKVEWKFIQIKRVLLLLYFLEIL